MLDPVFNMPPNVAYTDVANTFTVNQAIAGTLSVASTVTAAGFVGDGSLLTNLKATQSVMWSAAGLKLVGDSTIIGPSKYYGTDVNGNRGYYALPVPATSSQWVYNSVTNTTVDPGVSLIRGNNAVGLSITEIAISATTTTGSDRAPLLRTVRFGDTIVIQDLGTPANWLRYSVASAPTDNGTWFRFPVVYVAGGGTNPGNGTTFLVSFTQTGTGNQPNIAYTNVANTFTVAPQTIVINAPANKGLIVKGAAVQTANLQEWQDSGSQVVGEFKPFGRLMVNQLSTNSTPDNDLSGLPTLLHLKQNSVSRFAVYGNGVINAYQSMSFSSAGTPCGITYGGCSVQFSDALGSVTITTGSAAAFNVVRTGNPSGTVITPLQFFKFNPTATPGAGFGGAIEFQLKSSTTADQQAGRLTTQWVDATHATRKARTSLSAFDFTAEREGLRVEADGTRALASVGGGAVTAGATLTIHTGVAAGIGLIVKGAVSQTANLTEWRDSADAICGAFNITGTHLTINTQVAADVGLRVNGLTGSVQTGDLIQWRDKDNRVGKISNRGALILPGATNLVGGTEMDLSAVGNCFLAGIRVFGTDTADNHVLQTDTTKNLGLAISDVVGKLIHFKTAARSIASFASGPAQVNPIFTLWAQAGTATNREIGTVQGEFVNTTDATRTGRLKFNAHDFTAAREFMRAESDGVSALTCIGGNVVKAATCLTVHNPVATNSVLTLQHTNPNTGTFIRCLTGSGTNLFQVSGSGLLYSRPAGTAPLTALTIDGQSISGTDKVAVIAMDNLTGSLGGITFSNINAGGHTPLRMCADTAAKIGFLGAAASARPNVTGSRGGNAALASLLTALATLGLITDSTTV